MDKYDYQPLAINHAVSWFRTATTGQFLCLASPTGTGKSYMEIGIQDALGLYLVTPRLSIAHGLLGKRGIKCETERELIATAEAHKIYTPIRFRNRLFAGKIPHVPGVIVDEAHHNLANSYRDVWLSCGCPPTILFTATPYRGTANGTKKFIEEFGEPTWIITLAEAAQRGVISLPTIEVVPLVDDDCVSLSATGEFDVVALESATLDRLDHAAKEMTARYVRDGKWDRPTCFALPGTETAKRLHTLLPDLTCVVTAKTPFKEREQAFAAMLSGERALLQVGVVSEGVDLPIRRLIDLAPKISPVAWMQQLGRVTRPTDTPPEYVCCNRNLQRHAYLLEGLIPPAKVGEAIAAFGGFGERAHNRALGLETLGRFKAVNVPLLDGNSVAMYLLCDKSALTEYACLIHSAAPAPVWAHRQHEQGNTGRIWGRWQVCKQPAELSGFASQSPSFVSEKQEAWWTRSAEGRGLKLDVKLTRKNFAILPMLFDLGISFKGK